MIDLHEQTIETDISWSDTKASSKSILFLRAKIRLSLKYYWAEEIGPVFIFDRGFVPNMLSWGTKYHLKLMA